MRDECDVLIIGMGAVGLTAALALAQLPQNWRIGLVGRADFRRQGRTVALFEGTSMPLLRKISHWDPLSRQAAPLKTIRLIDQTDTLFPTPQLDFHAHEIGLEAFGWNIETQDLVAHLYSQVTHNPLISIYEESFEGFKTAQDFLDVTCASGAQIQTKLLIAADGTQSSVRDSAQIKSERETSDQIALTAVFSHTRPHEGISTEFHTRAGPCTLVPLPAKPHALNRSSLVWVLTKTEAAALQARPPEEITAALMTRIHYILGEMHLETDVSSFPLSSLQVSTLTAPRLALVGDAAHGLPPIGAQGLNLGLRDVATLSDLLAQRSTEDPGALGVLARYATQRQADIWGRHHMIAWLNTLPRRKQIIADAARAFGLTSLALCPLLRTYLMREGIR